MNYRYLPPRRRLLKCAAAAGLSSLLPACRPTEPSASVPAAAPDFGDGALRLDFRQRITGGAAAFTLERLRFEPQWPGRRDGLADGLDWGDYRLSVYDPERESLLFRQGFDTGLDAAARSATSQVSVRLPMPRRPVRAAIERRRGESAFGLVSSVAIDPEGGDIDRSARAAAPRVATILSSGEPASKVDLAILGDGYRQADYAKFVADAARAADYLFSVEPFRKRSRDFNVSSVFVPSADSGVTDEYLGLRKDTAFRCAYYSGGSERALADGDNGAVREAASAVPYDFLLILANARRYGGGAHFGGPAVVAIDSAAARYLVIHEFAHVIGALADEYYIPAGAGPAYAGNIEPWQPNVTIFPERGKWRGLLSEPGVRPTPWNKAQYERDFASYVRRYNALRAAGVAEADIDKLMDDARKRQRALLAHGGNGRRVGYFEGANGYARGVFRAEVDCIMFSLQAEYYCAACAAAIESMIDQHCR